MRFLRASAIALFCLSAPTPPTPAQQVELSHIEFTGDTTHTQAELLAFTGLKPGLSTQQAVQDGAQKLNDTGLFSEVTFQSSGTSLTYSIRPVASTETFPIRFTNFVWWDDKDLVAALTARVPLFHGDTLPRSGNMRELGAAVLTSLVAEKGVADPHITSRLSASHINGPPDTIAFSIESPWVLIHTLTLQPASPAMQTKLQRVIQDLTGQQYDKDAALPDISSRVDDVYRNDGYLDIAVTHLDRSAPILSPQSIAIDLTATLSEGPQYRVSQLTWPGSPLISAADFAKQSPLKPGDPASPPVLRRALHVLAVAYSTKGFIDARFDAPPQIDRASHLVAYTIAADPGPQYKFNSIQWNGLPPDQMKRLDWAFQLKPGEIYDATYINRFIAQIAQPDHRDYKISYSTRPNINLHTVDLTVSFTKLASGAPN